MGSRNGAATQGDGGRNSSRRWRCFADAWRGIKVLVATQSNARIHAAVTLVVCGLGAALRIGRSDWGLLAMAIGLVWSAEAMNTAIEFLADEVSLEHRERIGKAKDLAAGAVLIAVVAAVAIGVIVFIPYLVSINGLLSCAYYIVIKSIIN